VGEEEGKDEERRMEGTLIASCSFGSVFGWSDREASAASQSGSRVSKEKENTGRRHTLRVFQQSRAWTRVRARGTVGV
jgi:hypothetical protein